jgi:uncharacterized protein YuzE
LRFEFYPDTDSLYIELNPGRKRKTGGSQEVVGQGNRDIVIDVDGDGVPVGIGRPHLRAGPRGGPERRVG